MAIITPSSLISEVRGSAGTLTYSKNKYRAYVKERVAPTDTPSDWKSLARDLLHTAVDNWKAFTDAQRLQWMTLAENFNTQSRLGQQKPIGGYQLYCRAWMNAYYGGESSHIAPEGPFTMPTVKVLTLTATESGLSFAAQVSATHNRLYYIIRACDGVAPSRMSVNSVTMVNIIGGSVYSTSISVDFLNDLYTRIVAGSYSAGLKIFCSFQLVDVRNGQTTPAMVRSKIITA